jgi:hypothetical protein
VSIPFGVFVRISSLRGGAAVARSPAADENATESLFLFRTLATMSFSTAAFDDRVIVEGFAASM